MSLAAVLGTGLLIHNVVKTLRETVADVSGLLDAGNHTNGAEKPESEVMEPRIVVRETVSATISDGLEDDTNDTAEPDPEVEKKDAVLLLRAAIENLRNSDLNYFKDYDEADHGDFNYVLANPDVIYVDRSEVEGLIPVLKIKQYKVGFRADVTPNTDGTLTVYLPFVEVDVELVVDGLDPAKLPELIEGFISLYNEHSEVKSAFKSLNEDVEPPDEYESARETSIVQGTLIAKQIEELLERYGRRR